MSECNFIDGILNGLSKGWYAINGRKLIEYNYIDGKLNGLCVSWHENGQKHREDNYIDGNIMADKIPKLIQLSKSFVRRAKMYFPRISNSTLTLSPDFRNLKVVFSNV